MSRTTGAGAGNALHGELTASLVLAHETLQGLMALSRGGGAGCSVTAAQLAALLGPVADQVEQALQVAEALAAP